MKLWRK